MKNKFPALNKKHNEKKLVYFDNACSALKPKPVIEAVNNYYSSLGSCTGERSAHILSGKAKEEVESSRRVVKDFLNAKSIKEIVWVRNSTEGINLVAHSFPFKKDSEVLLIASEHHSNLLPFYEQSKRRDFKLKIFYPDSRGVIDLNKLKKNITDQTSLVAITQMSNVTGLKHPIGKIAKLAHNNNAKILVDNAQYITSNREDVQSKNIDMTVFSFHKIGGPTGIGVLYCKRDLLKEFSQFNTGGGVVESVNIESNGKMKVNYLPEPFRFEAGIQNYAGIIGSKKAISFLVENDPSSIKETTAYMFEKLTSIPEVELVGNPKKSPDSLISFYFKNDYSLHDFNIFLNHDFDNLTFAVRVGHHCAQPFHNILGVKDSMRVSFFLYNNKAEVDKFEKAIKAFLDK